ncbi:MAG: hypothetical protein Q7S21_00780 [archaeon]|nr:hypothetical protein [archaeon]
MDENDLALAILIGIGIIIFLIVLSLPVKGNVFGYELELPLIGWIAFAAFAVIALYLFFKHRA